MAGLPILCKAAVVFNAAACVMVTLAFARSLKDPYEPDPDA